LHEAHKVMPATLIGGGASAQDQCQLRTIAVASGGGCGTAATASPMSQFHDQFQTNVRRAFEERIAVIPFKLSAVILPVSAVGGVLFETGDCGATGVELAGSAAAGAGDGSGGGVASTTGKATGGSVGMGGSTADGIGA
jgi:hypothetical protein